MHALTKQKLFWVYSYSYVSYMDLGVEFMLLNFSKNHMCNGLYWIPTIFEIPVSAVIITFYF